MSQYHSPAHAEELTEGIQMLGIGDEVPVALDLDEAWADASEGSIGLAGQVSELIFSARALEPDNGLGEAPVVVDLNPVWGAGSKAQSSVLHLVIELRRRCLGNK